MNKKCPLCIEGFLERKIVIETHTYKGHSKQVEQQGEWCNVCKEGVLSESDLKATQKQISDFQSRIDGLLTSDEIKKIRKKLRLTQKQAARICGGGVNAFSRYERGEVAPMRAVSVLLHLLDKYPNLLNEIDINLYQAQ